jgi:uncharacterized membrane protein
MPAYLRMLASILISYAIIIGFGDNNIGSPARVGLLGFLLWTAARLHTDRRLRWWALVFGIATLLLTTVSVVVASPRVTSGVVGGCSIVLIAMAIGAIVSTLVGRWRVDTDTVLGVLCIYLLFALLFAGAHQFFASIQSHYLNGVGGRPTASDFLYFSVITLTTVGFGDITPASQLARAITVVEALVGQLYLVSVVAGVVSGWREATRDRDEPGP